MGDLLSDDESFLAELEEQHLSLSFAQPSGGSAAAPSGSAVAGLDDELLAELEAELDLALDDPGEGVGDGEQAAAPAPAQGHAGAARPGAMPTPGDPKEPAAEDTGHGAGGSARELVVTTEEFGRMQAELVALKTAKYEGETRERKLRQHIQALEVARKQQSAKTATARGKEFFSGVFKRDKPAAGTKGNRRSVGGQRQLLFVHHGPKERIPFLTLRPSAVVTPAPPSATSRQDEPPPLLPPAERLGPVAPAAAAGASTKQVTELTKELAARTAAVQDRDKELANVRRKASALQAEILLHKEAKDQARDRRVPR